MSVTRQVLRYPDASSLYRSAAEFFVSAAADAIQARGTYTVALAGGTTPKAVYSLLADDAALRSRVAWKSVEFFWGDERHVGPDHPESNFRMAWESMLSRLPIDPSHVWRIKGEYARASDAAEEYERDLRDVFGLDAEQMPDLDLVMLGLGADGHTASLFPGTEALHEQGRLVVANRVEQLQTDRITLTLPVLNNAEQVVFVVQGDGKAEALKAVIEGPYSPDRLPAQLICPTRGRLTWLADRSAARLLSSTTASGLGRTV